MKKNLPRQQKQNIQALEQQMGNHESSTLGLIACRFSCSHYALYIYSICYRSQNDFDCPWFEVTHIQMSLIHNIFLFWWWRSEKKTRNSLNIFQVLMKCIFLHHRNPYYVFTIEMIMFHLISYEPFTMPIILSLPGATPCTTCLPQQKYRF